MDKKHLKPIVVLCFIMLQGLSVSHANNEIDFSKAEQYKKQGKYNKANWIYFASLENKTNITEAHYGLAESAYRKRNYKGALKRIHQVLKRDKNHSKALSLRSHISIQQQQWQKALDDIEQLQALGQDSAEMYMQLDAIYSALGDRDAANAALNTYKQKQRSANATSPVKK